MYKQAQKLVHCSNLYHNDQAGELASTLVDMTKQFGGLGLPPLANSSSASTDQETLGNHKVFFANSGAEANVSQNSLTLESHRGFFDLCNPKSRKAL